MELPLSDYGVQPAQGAGTDPDDEEEEEALTQDPFTIGTLGPGRPAPAHGLLGVQVGADHQTANTGRKAGKDREQRKASPFKQLEDLPCWGPGCHPWSGPEIPQAAGCNQKKKNKS